MELFTTENHHFKQFTDDVEKTIEELSAGKNEDDINGISKFLQNFRLKTEDFYKENRKLNIGVVGQVKAGKSSFLNTLLFNGEEILPKASTPKTATLTKMEYSEENIIQIEYYSPEEWDVLEENARVDLEDEIYTSAREIVEMVRNNGIEPKKYLEKGIDRVKFDTYEELIVSLNDYVGEDGRYTALVKAVTLFLNKEEFKGISIVDTPGLNDPIASRTIRTKEFMEVCDVVFFLSQSTSFLDKSDWTLLSSQLPQKGVKRLVLIASKYDSGIRDILRVKNDDDIFGEDDNTADNIPKACKIIRKKLKKRAKSKVSEFVNELEQRESYPELIDVIRQCQEPLMVSSLAYNMTGKTIDEYSSEEKNLYSALIQFSSDIDEDLRFLGNFDEVKKLFAEVVKEKEEILEKKSKSFVPIAKEEIKGLLLDYKEKAEKRMQVLEGNDREELIEKKKYMEAQMGSIKADIAQVFGDFNARLESEKAKGNRQLREAGKDYMHIDERQGTVTKTRTYTTGHLFWKKTHTEHYDEHYSYFMAADAIESINKYAIDAANNVENVFEESLNQKELKRKLINVVINNFDMGSEKYDASLFTIMVEETVSNIEFPIFRIDIKDKVDGISAKFTGEITSADKKVELTTALSEAISSIYRELSDELVDAVKKFRQSMNEISEKVSKSLLANIMDEFEKLLSQCENKDKEIAGYKAYTELLTKCIGKF